MGAFQVADAPGGRARPGAGPRHPVPITQCLLLLASAPPDLHLWPWSESETGHLGRDSILPGHYDRPGNFSIFRRIPNSSPICKGSVYERYGKISGRAYSGKLASPHSMTLSLQKSLWLLHSTLSRGSDMDSPVRLDNQGKMNNFLKTSILPVLALLSSQTSFWWFPRTVNN